MTIATYTGVLADGVFIARETDPWVEVDGEPVDWMVWTREHAPVTRVHFVDGQFAPTCTCAGSPVVGVLEAMNTADGIQRCDECETFDGDLSAALALANLVGGTVKFETEENN